MFFYLLLAAEVLIVAPAKPSPPRDPYEVYSATALTEKIETQFLALPYCQTTLRVDEDRSGSTVKSYKATASCKLLQNDDIFLLNKLLVEIEAMISALKLRSDALQTQLKAATAISTAIAPYCSELAAFVKALDGIKKLIADLVDKLGCVDKEPETKGANFTCREYSNVSNAKLEQFPLLYSQFAAKLPQSLPDISFFPKLLESDFLNPIELKRKSLVREVFYAMDFDSTDYSGNGSKPIVWLRIPEPIDDPMFYPRTTPSEADLKIFFNDHKVFKQTSQEIIASVVALLRESQFSKSLGSFTVALAKKQNDISIDRDQTKRNLESVYVYLNRSVGTSKEQIVSDIQKYLPIFEELYTLANAIAPQISFSSSRHWGSIDLDDTSKELANLRQLATVNDRLVALIEKHQMNIEIIFDYDPRSTQSFDFEKITKNTDKGSKTILEIRSNKNPFSGEDLVNALTTFLANNP